MKRRVRVIAARMRRAARAHYMLAVTGVVVLIAAAGAIGFFDPAAQSERPERNVQAAATATPIPPPGTPGAAPFLTVTYVLVSSEEERAIWRSVVQTINQRELLSTMAMEVFVITNEEQEAAAYELIEAARERYPWNEYVVDDRRSQ